MQICTSPQTDNHASTPPLSFLQAGCPSCSPTNSVKALKEITPKTPLKRMDQKTPQNLPISLGHMDPSNTLMPGPTLLTTPNGSWVASHTFTQVRHKFTLVTMGQPTFTPKLPFPWGDLHPASTCLILAPSQPTTPNGIQIQSAVFPQYTGQRDTHIQTK